jgi:predicted transcriptional regulator
MSKLILTVTLSLFLLGCNMNPSKESRLQKLEAQIEQSMDKVSALENRIQALEKANALLEKKVTELEEN